MLYASGATPRYRIVLYPVTGFVLAAISALCLSRIDIFDHWPDLMTLYALFFALYDSERSRYMPSMVIGLTRDLLSAGPLGTYAILYALLHRCVAPRRKSLHRDNPVTLSILAALVVAATTIAYHCVLVAKGIGIGWSMAIEHGLVLGLISAPFMPLMTYGFIKIFERLGIERLPGGNFNV